MKKANGFTWMTGNRSNCKKNLIMVIIHAQGREVKGGINLNISLRVKSKKCNVTKLPNDFKERKFNI